MKRKYVHNPETHRAGDAAIIMPLVLQAVGAKSVVDVGCGTGTFLQACARLGLDDLLGVDGDYVDRSLLQIKTSQFLAADLAKPLAIDRKFDLVLCLEVAEHLPPASAEAFIESLVRLGDVVLFSAAIPGQGGQHHLNEQWPSYWREKFARHNYHFHDALREKLWDHRGVFWWYRQNMILVAKGDRLPAVAGACGMVDVVHPELWVQLVRERQQPTIGVALRRLIKAVVQAVGVAKPRQPL